MERTNVRRSRLSIPFFASVVTLALAACHHGAPQGVGIAEDVSGTQPIDGEGSSNTGGSNGSLGQASTADGKKGCTRLLHGVIRDFSDQHPDFEKFSGNGETGIVKDALGPDGKPVYAPEDHSELTTGRANFDQWYRDVDGVNIAIPYTVRLKPYSGGNSTFDAQAFFPIDDQGWGNEGRDHNFHFTLEIHSQFLYTGGEYFNFIGDDDLWVFVNGKLALDLGGTHIAESGTFHLDDLARTHGLVKGNVYDLAIFQAERHTPESHFYIDTTVGFTECESDVR